MATGVKKIIRDIWRYPYCIYQRKKLHNNDFCILSQNCMGGLLCHDLGVQFNSPTINLSMSFDDYLKLIKKLDYYLEKELVFKRMQNTVPYDYPICTLGDLTLHMVHYRTFEEANKKWEIRKQRIKKDKIMLMCTDREGGNTKESIEKLLSLPYPKVCFVHSKDLVISNEVIFVPGYEKCTELGDIVSTYRGILGHRAFQKYFNCVEWINSSKNKGDKK